MNILLSDFDYTYPPELVASYPLPQRDASRMMVIDRKNNQWEHHVFKDFSSFFKEGDVLVFNDSKVFPCRLFSQKKTGGKVEIFLIREVEADIWECLVTDSKKIPQNEELSFSRELCGVMMDEGGNPTRKIHLHYSGILYDILERVGHVPLPRYIKRKDVDSDRERYQTLFARNEGSVAAPTAGFHFSEEIISQLKLKGVQIVFITLHVGIGTFLPIRAEKIQNHTMHGEYFEIPEKTVQTIVCAKKEMRSVTAIGTTVVRALESAFVDGRMEEGKGYTDKFIYPPFKFNIVDRLLTNFHQPKSTLLLMVCAFAGREFVLNAYKEAIARKYRFFSYGDCMLVL